MSYPQFGYSYSSPSQLLMSNNHNSPCCDSSRPMVTDPLTGQTVCSCQYDSWTIGYSRLGTTGAIYSASYADQTYPSISIEPAPLYGSLANSYGLKDSSSEINGWTQSATHYSYDMSAYGYGNYDLNGTRRKNATRETTSTLKAWLSEHKKNPYPTKGEKIMLAIITKMTLTQVSTWFANARRRLKKENKMTWEPKNKTSEDGDESSDSDDETLSKKQESDEIRIDRDSTREGLDDKSCDSLVSDVLHHKPLDSSPQSCAQVSSSSFASTTSIPTKPKIWSLADTATCKTPPPPPTAGPFQSSPAWVPSVGAFQVPSLQASRSFGSNLTPELHADTPPQTPPNLKVPTCHHENNAQSPLNYTSHLNVVTNTRFRPPSGEPSHSSMAQSHSSTPLYNSTDMTNTAFKPVVKRENPWT